LPADPIRRLAALNVFIAEDGERLSQRLRLANVEQARLVSMGEGWWQVSPEAGEATARVLLYRLEPQHFLDRVMLAWSRKAAKPDDSNWRSLATLPQRWATPIFPLRAADFMQRGVAKGPALGAVIRVAEEAWISAGFPLDEDGLKRIADAAVNASARSARSDQK
jgi:hypothetical protein